MPLTGVLGTADSQLGNLELAAASGPSRTLQNLQLRARIQNTSTQGLQLRARIQTTADQSLQLKANIRAGASISLRGNILGTTTQGLQLRAHLLSTNATLSLKARIAPGLSLRARLLSLVTSNLEVDYSVQVPLSANLLVNFNATTAVKAFHSLQMQAKIVPVVTAGLSVSFDLCYSMPAPPILRPTQRGEFRTVRTLTMKARIRTCSVVLIGNTYQTICT